MDKMEQFVRSVREACDVYLKPYVPTPDPIFGDVYIDTPGTIIGQHFNGSVTVRVPDVSFEACSITGQIPDQILLTAHHRTKLFNCDLMGSVNGQHRGIRSDAHGIRVINTRVKNIWWDIDTQAIGGWDGTKDLLVDNCDLEASGEIVMWGGSTLSSEDGVCEDITVQNSRLTRNLEWLKKLRGETIKNFFEVKCGRRIKILNNDMQYNWIDGQDGYAMLITLRQDPSPWGDIQDIQVVGNRISDTAACFNILGMDDMSNNPEDNMIEGILLKDNSFKNVNTPEMGRTRAGEHSLCRAFVILNGSKDMHLIGNTIKGENFGTALTFGGAKSLHYGMRVEENLFPEGLYGIHGEGAPALGEKTLAMYAPDYVWKKNRVSGHIPEQGVEWPKGTEFV